jgi:hypothetical protein
MLCSETLTAALVVMVWFYERQGHFIRCETRDVPGDTITIELVVLQPDGTETVERYESSDALARRQQELQSSLTHSGWQGPFGRTI